MPEGTGVVPLNHRGGVVLSLHVQDPG